MVHPVGSHCTDISRCNVNKTLDLKTKLQIRVINTCNITLLQLPFIYSRTPIIRTLVILTANYPDACYPDRQLSGRLLS